MKRVAVALSVVMLALPLGGCAKLRERFGRKGADETSSGAAPASAGALTVGPGPVVPTVSSGKLPDGWPPGLPPYPGAIIVSATNSAAGKNVILRTRDSALKVREYYMDRLAATKLQTDLTIPGQPAPSMVMSFKDGDTIITVTIAPTPTRETTVSLGIAPKR
jgi:hypothetical protein